MREKVIKLIALILVLLSLAIQIFAQGKTLDEFNSTDGWKIFASDGVELKISMANGFKGKCIRIDYNFTKGSGYGGIQKIIPIEFPENFQLKLYSLKCPFQSEQIFRFVFRRAVDDNGVRRVRTACCRHRAYFY